MAYNYETNKDSPNYTPARLARNYFGYDRVIEGITLHWWGDPAQNPQFDNVTNYLCRSGGNSSAHYVASGTGRRVACIVSPNDVAWHSGSAWGNARTIGIECDPRARDEDYDVVAELVADIRSAYGDVPIYWHSYFSATACPGVWNPNRVDALSYTKSSHPTEWGKGGNKVATPAPQPVLVPEAVKLDKPIRLTAKGAVNVWDLSTAPNYQSVKVLASGETFEAYAAIAFNNTTYYVTKYSFDKGKKVGVNIVDMKQNIQAPQQTPSPTTKDDAGNPVPGSGQPVTEKPDYAKENNGLLKQLLELVQWIVNKLTSVFK